MPVNTQTLARPHAGRRLVMPAPLARFGGRLQALINVFQEARDMQRRAHARWPFMEE